jgi:hypothetical protein
MKALLAAILAVMYGMAMAAEKSPAGTSKEKEGAYEKAVQACGKQSGAEKQKCIEDAKERHGEMLK